MTERNQCLEFLSGKWVESGTYSSCEKPLRCNKGEKMRRCSVPYTRALVQIYQIYSKNVPFWDFWKQKFSRRCTNLSLKLHYLLKIRRSNTVRIRVDQNWPSNVVNDRHLSFSFGRNSDIGVVSVSAETRLSLDRDF